VVIWRNYNAYYVCYLSAGGVSLCWGCVSSDPEADDVTQTEGRRGEESGTQRRNHRRGEQDFMACSQSDTTNNVERT